MILNFMHHGSYDGAAGSLGRLGVPCHMLVYPYMVREDAPALAQAAHAGGADGRRRRPSAPRSGPQGIIDLLNQGEVVAIASDVPGRTPVRFAGRDVRGSFGAARIAADAGSPVVVMTSEDDDRGPFVRIHEPSTPRTSTHRGHCSRRCSPGTSA